MQNLKGKSVTILKLLIRVIYCRQAETHSSIRLDSTSKRVRTLILSNCKKLCGGIILWNGILLFTNICPDRCKRFLNSKKLSTYFRVFTVSGLGCRVWWVRKWHIALYNPSKPVDSSSLDKYTYFFYKHLVYKHAQPQILGKFKHIAKHAPGWDFWFENFFL